MAEKQAFRQPIPPENCWIKYQLNLRNIKYEVIAQKANRTLHFVSMVVCGRRRSQYIGSILAGLLGYGSYEELMEAARMSVREGVE